MAKSPSANSTFRDKGAVSQKYSRSIRQLSTQSMRGSLKRNPVSSFAHSVFAAFSSTVGVLPGYSTHM